MCDDENNFEELLEYFTKLFYVDHKYFLSLSLFLSFPHTNKKRKFLSPYFLSRKFSPTILGKISTTKTKSTKIFH